MKNNNLIIYYKDKSKDVFSFSLDVTEEEALGRFESIRPEVDKEQIEKYFYTKNDETPLDTYGRFSELKDGKVSLDARSLIIDGKLDEIRKKRDALLSKLDIPFMRALEDEQEQVKTHIIKLKNFLRQLPENLRINELQGEEILRYNPFGNIFEIALINGGSGYQKPPKVVIDTPRKPIAGFAPKVTASINGGSVVSLVITYNGSGYDYMPKITIEDPEEGQTALALCLPPQNVLLTEDQIVENTRQHYLK